MIRNAEGRRGILETPGLVDAVDRLPSLWRIMGHFLWCAAGGTLTSVAESLKGTATWTSNNTDPNLFALLFPGTPAVTQVFLTPGTITFAMSGSPTDLNDFKGTGSVGIFLSLNTSDLGDAFATSASGLMGTITYTYTPAASHAVPEPSTWAMLLIGFAGIALAGYRRAKPGHA